MLWYLKQTKVGDGDRSWIIPIISFADQLMIVDVMIIYCCLQSYKNLQDMYYMQLANREKYQNGQQLS